MILPAGSLGLVSSWSGCVHGSWFWRCAFSFSGSKNKISNGMRDIAVGALSIEILILFTIAQSRARLQNAVLHSGRYFKIKLFFVFGFCSLFSQTTPLLPFLVPNWPFIPPVYCCTPLRSAVCSRGRRADLTVEHTRHSNTNADKAETRPSSCYRSTKCTARFRWRWSRRCPRVPVG